MATNLCRNPDCEFFNRPLPNNAKFCPSCSKALSNWVASSQVSTSPATTADPTPKPDAPAIPSPQARPVFKLIHTSKREFYLSGEEGYIGRRGQTTKIIPEIDLTGIPNEGVVSRSHARVYWDWSQNVYMLIDNNSTNGTYINGTPLAPGFQYRLNNGDSLQLGQNQLVCFTISVR